MYTFHQILGNPSKDPWNLLYDYDSTPIAKKKSDNESELSYEIEVPGVPPDKLKLKVEGQKIILNCPRGNYHIAIPSGANVDTENTKAKLKYGILTVTLLKKKSPYVEISVESD